MGIYKKYLNEVKTFEYEGEQLSKAKLMKKAISKALVKQGTRKINLEKNSKWVFIMIMKDNIAFDLTPLQFFKLDVKDDTTQQNKDDYIRFLLDSKIKQFRKKVDFNGWVQRNNPSFKERYEWIMKNK